MLHDGLGRTLSNVKDPSAADVQKYPVSGGIFARPAPAKLNQISSELVE